jgi:hypothetical protein
MAQSSKKIAAALAAVNAYMQEEEGLAQQNSTAKAEILRAQHGPSPWSLTGRQQIMSMRQLIQMKAFSRF